MTKNIVLLWMLLLLSFTITIAQNNLPPVYEIKSDTANEQHLEDAYYEVLEDKKGNWTINQVSQSPLANQFHSRKLSPKGVDTIVNTYWFRYRLKNVMNKETKISLNSWADQSDFYVFKGTNEPKHYVTGWEYPWSKKNGFKRDSYIPMILRPGEEFIIYCRIYIVDPGIPEIFKIDFYNTEKLIQTEFIDRESDYIPISTFQYTFFFGFFLLAACYNFFFFLIVREKVYLYFSLFLLFSCISNNTLLVEILPREHPQIARYLINLFVFWLFFIVHFTRHYFKTFFYFPRWDKYLIVINTLQVVAGIVWPYTVHQSEAINAAKQIIVVALILSIFVTLFYAIRKRDRPAKLFLIATLPVVLHSGIGIILGFVLYNSVGHPRIQIPGFLRWWLDWGNVISNLTMSWLVLFFSWILFKRYDEQKKEIAQQALDKERVAKEKEIERSELIEQQKIDLEKTVEERTTELKQSLQNLKSAQAQLIQSEKMASLGELTAGIAHEIQNPLNFVNNFSEVNRELIDEMQQEMDKGNYTDAKDISNDIKENEEKINQHGKRADSIVKGMMQHSQVSTGQKEPTDINALADEYLRLAYHGLRAKDKTFNAAMKTEFDSSIEKVKIVSQDIGRVLLNLYNNAFYAVGEKKKQQGEGYEPIISVSTKKLSSPSGDGGKVEIRVKDNGNGISQKVIDKIFQPFFTTKPTGQGTGLGLSLSYDIIKAHGGEIKVETTENVGTEFTIILPIN